MQDLVEMVRGFDQGVYEEPICNDDDITYGFSFYKVKVSDEDEEEEEDA